MNMSFWQSVWTRCGSVSGLDDVKSTYISPYFSGYVTDLRALTQLLLDLLLGSALVM